MKTNFFIILFFIISLVNAQEKEDSVFQFYDFKKGKNDYELSFQKIISSSATLNSTLDSLYTIGYYTLSVDSISHEKVYLNRGKLYKNIWVKNDTIFNKNQDWFAVRNLDSLMQSVTNRYANLGYPFTRFKIIPQGYKNDEVKVQLIFEKLPLRKINHVTVEGYPQLSQGYIKHRLGLKKGNIYQENELRKLTDKINSNSYIEEIKPAQTLFNTDSTTIYLYIKKVKSNFFDGILGFGNDENGDFRLNGNVKLELNNNFNGMEQIRVNWIATADKSTTLDLNVRVPFMFRSPIGSDTRFNLYRKDSVFVNLKLEERIFYQLTQNSNIGLNFIYENSNFVLDKYPEIAMLYNDYSKSGYGLSYEWVIPSPKKILEAKSTFFISGKTLRKKGSERDPTTLDLIHQNATQYEVGLHGFYLFTLSDKHLLKTQIQGYSLFSELDYFTENELYRIGGFNNLRGFNEESITASSYGIGSLEYRFMPNEGFYISTFIDWAMVENKVSKINENFLGIGAGLSFLTQLGIFNISYAVGKQSNTSFDTRNSKIHFGILTRF